MSMFHHVKVYKRKFVLYLLIISLISSVLFLLTSAFFLSGWVREQQNAADSAFERSENTIKETTVKLDTYMQRLYNTTNYKLQNDFRWFSANDAEGYLTKRLSQSKYNDALISFPDDIRYFLMGMPVSRVSLHAEKFANVIRLTEREATHFDFQISNADPRFSPSLVHGFEYCNLLGENLSNSRRGEEIRFLISSEMVFRPVASYDVGFVFLTDDAGTIYPVLPQENIPDEIITEVLARAGKAGQIRHGLLGYHFKVRSSSQFPYQFVDIVSERAVIASKSSTLLFIAGLFLIIAICLAIMILFNLRHDARFLRDIVDTMGQVKQGDFSATILQNPIATGNSKYQLIAKELEAMVYQLDEYIDREYLLKLQQKEIEMQAFQHQINPHFLYNTLEIIRASALVGGQTTVADSIANLGALYREILREKENFTLADELTLLERYLKIMEMRYPNIFYYQFDIPPTMQQIPTVKLWLQPLAENFFIHGFDNESRFNLLILKGYQGISGWVLELVDNGSFIPKEKLDTINKWLLDMPTITGKTETKIGIKNVFQRLRLFYGDGLTMQVSNNPEAGIKIVVHIPKGEESDV